LRPAIAAEPRGIGGNVPGGQVLAGQWSGYYVHQDTWLELPKNEKEVCKLWWEDATAFTDVMYGKRYLPQE